MKRPRRTAAGNLVFMRISGLTRTTRVMSCSPASMSSFAAKIASAPPMDEPTMAKASPRTAGWESTRLILARDLAAPPHCPRTSQNDPSHEPYPGRSNVSARAPRLARPTASARTLGFRQ